LNQQKDGLESKMQIILINYWWWCTFDTGILEVRKEIWDKFGQVISDMRK
jgi:hypothetical protein